MTLYVCVCVHFFRLVLSVIVQDFRSAFMHTFSCLIFCIERNKKLITNHIYVLKIHGKIEIDYGVQAKCNVIHGHYCCDVNG